MKLGEKITIVMATAVAMAFVSALLLKRGRKMWSIVVFVIVAVVGGIVVAIEHSHDSNENFDLNNSEGCNQTINIIQNCKDGPQPKPWKPVQPKLSKNAVSKWIEKTDPSLTKQCKSCILDSAMRLWTDETFQAVVMKSHEKQQQILKALLVFDCDKQCTVTPNRLDKKMVSRWLMQIFNDQPIEQNCFNCIEKSIMNLWSPEDFQKTIHKPAEQQRNIVEALLIVHCENCQNSNNLKRSDVENWLSSVLTGSSTDCYKCAVDSILRLWSPKDMNKVKKMNKKSQRQVAEAIVDLDCSKQCVHVPTGLRKDVVKKWLNSVLTGANNSCQMCVVDAIVRMWTPAIFHKVQTRSKLEQSKVVHGLLMLNCHSECVHNTVLSRNDVEKWAENVLPNASKSCRSCIVDKGMQMWNSEEFHKLKSMPTSEQAKLAMLFSDFNCPHVCQLEPYKDCDYLPY